MLLRLLGIFVLGVLLLPVLEIFAMFWLGAKIGWWLLLWLLVAAAAGLLLIKSWRVTASWAILDSVRQGQMPIGRLFWVARSMLAGVLLMIPGPISDVLALILLLPWPGLPSIQLPRMQRTHTKATPPTDDSAVFEGEYQRVAEPTAALEHPDKPASASHKAQ